MPSAATATACAWIATRSWRPCGDGRREGKPFCLLGYTYMLYEHVVRPLREEGIRIELPPSTFVVHFGGWKKLRQQAVTKPVLTDHAAAVFGLAAGSIVDIYGFTEQLGVIYPDDSQGVKRTPTYAEVLVRDPARLEIVPDGDVGLLEFVCPLPHSYPGIAVLLDDMGRIVAAIPAATSRAPASRSSAGPNGPRRGDAAIRCRSRVADTKLAY